MSKPHSYWIKEYYILSTVVFFFENLEIKGAGYKESYMNACSWRIKKKQWEQTLKYSHLDEISIITRDILHSNYSAEEVVKCWFYCSAR